MNDHTKNTFTLGALSAVSATLFFSINDAAIKFLSGGYALHQIVFIRSLVALAILLVVVIPLGNGLTVFKTRRLLMHLMRGLCVVFANMTFFVGLSVLPLADAVAVFFVSPLIITALSVVFLNEKVGPQRWLAVIAGLIGVVIMVQPGADSFRPAILLPFASAFGYAMLHILTRKIGKADSAATMTVYIQLVFILVSGGIGLTLGHGAFAGQGGAAADFVLRAWVWPTGMDWPLLALLGFASAAGGFFISQAYRISEASLIAPLEYLAMPIAVINGILLFGEWPTSTTWIGIALILSSGLFVGWRENVKSRKPALASPRLRR